MDFLIGSVAAMGACIFNNPVDVLKTRMQLQGELKCRGQHKIFYIHTLHAAYVVATNEGIRSLQKGLLPSLLMHGLRNGVKLGSYQWLNSNGFICDNQGKTIFFRSFLASSFSGMIGAFIANPSFLIKTQLQSQAAIEIAVGHQHDHAGVIQAFKRIYFKHCIRGFWRGANASLIRSFVGASAQLTTFAKSKDILQTYEPFHNSKLLTSFSASVVGGFIQAIFQTPLDLIATRLYNQVTDVYGQGILYKGTIDCMLKTWRSEGIFGLYKGFGANYARIARQTSLCLVFWDLLKDLQNCYNT